MEIKIKIIFNKSKQQYNKIIHLYSNNSIHRQYMPFKIIFFKYLPKEVSLANNNQRL